ncbi:MAG: AAA family ATPase [Chitinivibrionales bacterium]|nr:AAA family ATPase [Chitinivibrionales bacterium]MBD3394981.1 AAA family ATPase [Chitinivibrionales bacterium]
MSKKIAISGKGGVGKSTLAGALALLMARRGMRVLAVDADPDANLASALGMPEELQKSIVPIAKQRALIEERTGAKVRQYGQIFKMNPDVSDVAARFATAHSGVALLVLGAIEGGGTGCACPENVIIRTLMAELVLRADEAVIMDMEAGIEHLGRATAHGVDTMVVVVEPGQRSIDSAQKILAMAGEIGLRSVRFVANKVMDASDKTYIQKNLPSHDILGTLPYSDQLRRGDRNGLSVLDTADAPLATHFSNILDALIA